MAADHTDNQSTASDRRATAERAGRALDDGRSVLLVGPAGIGKTTLAGGLIADRGAVVAQCLDCFTSLAYRPLSHAFATPLSGTPDAVATELAGALDDRLLVVEDLHWADSSTLNVLALLAERSPLLMTSRVVPPVLEPVSIDEITLGPLARPLALTLARRLHPNLSPGDRAALVTAAAGNPLLIAHLARDDVVSPTFEAAIADRVRRLPGGTLDMLGRLAIHGRPASSDELDVPDPAIIGDVVVERDDCVWFAHERFAAAILELLDHDRLARLRTDLAAVSEPADAARHYFALGRRDDAARCAIAAADDADPSARADLLALAVDALDGRASNDLLLRAADAMISAHRPTDARRMASLVEAGGDPVVAAAAGFHVARAAWLDGDRVGAAATVDDSLDLVRGSGTAIEAELTIEQAAIAVRTRVGDPAIIPLADAALTLAEARGLQRARALNVAGLARAHTGQPGWANYHEAAAEAARADGDGDVEEECAARYWLVSAYGFYGPMRKALDLDEEMMLRTRQLGLRKWHHNFLSAYAMHLTVMGGVSDDVVDAFRRLLVDEPLFRNRGHIELGLTIAYLDRGSIDAAADLVDDARRRARNDEERALACCVRCEVALAARDPGMMERALAELSSHGQGYFGLNAVAESAAIHLAVSMPAPSPIPEFPTTLTPTLATVHVEREAYELQLAGRPLDAIETMTRAAEVWERGDMRRFARRARCATAEIAVAAGEFNRAHELLDGIDMSDWPESVTRRRVAELRRLVNRSRVERLLTHREIEVLTHVAAGLTSAQIAARLGITTATVDSHVSDARQRLGCRTRRQAAAMVVA